MADRHVIRWDGYDLESDSEGALVKWDDYATLEAEKQQIEAENRKAREACPVARMQDYHDAPLLTVVREQVSQLFRMQSRAEAAESQLHTLREAVREKVDKLEGYGFECIAGPLEKATDWQALRALVLTPQGETSDQAENKP